MDSSRRQVFKSAAMIGALSGATVASQATARPSKANDRAHWVATLDRIALPVLGFLSRGELRASMPVEQKPGAGREKFSHLEAFGRLLCGIAPWLAAEGLSVPEGNLQHQYRVLATAALDEATHPQSPDYMNFSDGGQALVDTAFLAQGLLRAPGVLWEPLPAAIKAQIVAALKASRQAADPKTSNWVMFSAMVEAALLQFGEPTLPGRLEDNVRLMINWYSGDGAYGDGEFFHFDYYNSLVIQPMLIDVLGVLKSRDAAFVPAYDIAMARSVRYAGVLERMIAPDGTFPSLGRSATYRYGAFQTLAQMALMQRMPEHVTPAQVRSALTAVIARVTGAPGTFDAKGWLQVGFCGHQPDMGEAYISTGSLYLCTAAFLPLGLSPDNAFWSAPAAKWTQQRLWAGDDLPADHAISDVHKVDIPALSPLDPPAGRGPG